MSKQHLALAFAMALVACSQASPSQVAQDEKERAAQQAVDAIRQSDPSLNWVRIGISTGKYSESIDSAVHQTYAECSQQGTMEDNECIPVPALPTSYWNAAKAAR